MLSIKEGRRHVGHAPTFEQAGRIIIAELVKEEAAYPDGEPITEASSVAFRPHLKKERPASAEPYESFACYVQRDAVICDSGYIVIHVPGL
jgi:hypothetical protein